ncbi:MAG: CRISPR-associated protein Cas4 [Candidatus Nitrosocaldus sp.]|nr:CRISPR-associated protein Cas4 [Candidatus Nitrosocaldus sp.]
MKNLSNIEPLDIKELEPQLQFTGTQINYYFVCKRKLWLFSHNMELESESDVVLLGRLLHEQSYRSKSKRMREVSMERVKIDFIEKANEVHEVKRSRKMEDAHVYQLLYYLYFIKHYTGRVMRGIIDYPLLRKRVSIELSDERERELQSILDDIARIVALQKPPEEEWKRYCRACAYRELCWC